MRTPPFKTDQDGRYLIPLQKFAAMLSMSRETLYRKINAGLIPAPLKWPPLSFWSRRSEKIRGFIYAG
jgi:predicted DNA-binding transcriptional regulator AlpA